MISVGSSFGLELNTWMYAGISLTPVSVSCICIWKPSVLELNYV